MKWMNPVAVGRTPYQPSVVEHWANIFSHGVFIVPAVLLSWQLLESVDVCDGEHRARYLACSIYAAALIMLFTVSTLFHMVCCSGKLSGMQQILHRADRAMIYLFIASSYTPWLLLKALPLQSWTIHLRWGIWVLAGVGIVYQQVFHEMFKMVDTIFYLIIGVGPSLAVVEMPDDGGITELKIGGALYLLGVIFFKLDGRLPLAHALWHLFVVAGSYVHYSAVATHLAHCGRDYSSLQDARGVTGSCQGGVYTRGQSTVPLSDRCGYDDHSYNL